MPTSNIYGDAGLVKYDYNGHTWLELKNPVHVTQNGQGNFTYAESLMVLPGAQARCVKCYVDIYVCTRVAENLDCYMKIVPGNVIRDGCSGIYYHSVIPGSNTGDNSYPSLLVTYPHDFRIVADVGTTRLKLTKPDGDTVLHGYNYLQNQPSNPSVAVQILRKQSGLPFANYGNSTYTRDGRRYHWSIGLGRSAGNQGISSRYSSGNLTSAWKSSPGWFKVGNLEKDFDWNEDKENFDGWIYFCGSAYYNLTYTNATKAVPRKITIPGLKRLMDYYPWAIRKSSTWMSCNRSGGYLKSRQGSSWSDRKNRES